MGAVRIVKSALRRVNIGVRRVTPSRELFSSKSKLHLVEKMDFGVWNGFLLKTDPLFDKIEEIFI